MGINRQKIKKWTNMILGKSSYHVNQDEGKVYSKTEIQGYYNNLTEKVSRFGLPGDTIPTTTVDSGETLYFPIAIFQYGLAAYDLLLLKQGDEADLKSKIIACANWAVENQQEDGSWVTFAYESPEYPFSSMAQGEAISLLVRAYSLNVIPEYVKQLKRDCSKKVVYITGHFGNYIYYSVFDKNCSSCGPEDFLSLLINSSYVVTNSFHATALAVLFEKQFSVVVDGGVKHSFNSRIYNLLSHYNIEDRIQNSYDPSLFSKAVDYTCFNINFENDRAQSINFIKKAINN